MMDQDESMDFKMLKARFQGENGLKIQTKPAIPEKPKTIPSPSTKINNPLISSINAAVQKGTLHAPRVVFKDDKNLSHQLSPPWGSKTKEKQPINNSELLDKNQKKEGDIFKQALKDRNFPLVLPVPPKKVVTPEPEPSPLTHLSVSPAKASTPKKFVFNTRKTVKDVNDKANTVETPTPASLSPDSPAPSHLAPASPSLTANTLTESVPVVPTALVPPSVLAERPQVPSIPAPSIPARGIPARGIHAFSSPDPEIPKPTIPTPVIPSRAAPKPEISKPEAPTSNLPDPAPPKPDINLLSLSEVFPPPEESFPLDFTDIPPPVIPDEDFPDGDYSNQATPSPAIRTSLTPVPRSPAVSRTDFPAQLTRPEVSPEPLVKPLIFTPGPVSVVAASPPPAVHTPVAPVKKVLKNVKALTDTMADKTEVDESSTKSRLALSALARAEEMAPIKWTTPQDNRVFNLLEKAKRKSTVSQLITTPENTTPLETASPEVGLPETATPKMGQPDLAPLEKALPQLATTVKTLPGEAPTVPEDPTFKLPAVDVDHAHLPPKTLPPETAQVTGLDHRQTLTGVLTVVKPVNPPPPPPRKPLQATPVVELPLEKTIQPPAKYLHIPTIPAETLETHEVSQFDNSFGKASFDDEEEYKSSAVPNFRAPSVPLSASDSKKTVSIHEKTFLVQSSLKHQTAEVERDNGEVDCGSVNSSSSKPDTQAAICQDSPVNQDGLSPSGTTESSDNVYEDLTNNKGRTLKNKKQKGPPKNPYADTATAMEETPKKGLFSRKNSAKAADEKELKKKEKQQEKEKEKEKERERKEQKEKEKKENEMKKRFKIKGQEEPIYHVKVIEDCKGSKNDLPVKVGDTVSIIRTTNCPKGKWLAKDSDNKYGYVPVESVDLNISGIMELGKMTTATNRSNGNGHWDGEVTSSGSRISDHYAMNHESFSDDSEEWACDDDEVYAPPTEIAHIGLNQTQATPTRVSVSESGPVQLTESDANYRANPEALQKLATFFIQPKTPSPALPENNTIKMQASKPENPGNLNTEEDNLEISDLQILPPPDLYADIIAADSMPIYSKPIKIHHKIAE
ncbi:proteoglycan 4-like isoform X2 [Myxocyprinus asiaticus]|uniref:proteoglycan 4-like isoform X2 n=1 Tax=Myxocyprinus asiaticus TaxID=70543 RepID=UPI002221AE58|nr:proteoglycan 4-like isoform X2 [Myxocyprinus asiaticus]